LKKTIYLKTLSLPEIKQIQLSILKKVAAFCEKKEITYFLCGGTLLGAIRHQGYIPWDDDIDIMLPRPDYDRFLSEFKDENLILHHHKNTKNYRLPFIKLGDKRTSLEEKYEFKKVKRGINIDIFPIDGFPKEQKEVLAHLKDLRINRRLILQKIFVFSESLEWHKRIVLSIFRFLIPGKRMITSLHQKAQKHAFSSSPQAGIAIWGYGIKEVCPRETFTKSIEVQFEGHSFKAPKDYDVYLSNVYGDYMKLPPKEKRISHHHFKATLKPGFTLEEICGG